MEVNTIGGSLLCFVGMILLLGFVFLASAIRVVPEYKRLRVYRLGRDIGEKGPGLVILIPVVDRATSIDKSSLVQVGETGSLLGMIGETQTTVYTTGTIQIAGRTWDSISDHPVAPKSKVRVRRIVLEVEEV